MTINTFDKLTKEEKMLVNTYFGLLNTKLSNDEIIKLSLRLKDDIPTAYYPSQAKSL